jgi:hypothetical protein
MTLTAVGVSYRLFAMFMLSPETDSSANSVGLLAGSAIVALYVSLAAGMFDETISAILLRLAIGFAVALALVYAHDVWRMVRARRRKVLELNSTAALVALLFLGVGMALLAIDMSADIDMPLVPAAFYLLGLGWLSGLGLAQLYKIVPFLTWLEAYGSVMGRAAVPRVQDLVHERPARLWFALYFAAVAAGGTGVLFGVDLALQVASWCQATAVIALGFEFVRARRLAYAPDPLRLPPGAVRPHLIFATTNSKE